MGGWSGIHPFESREGILGKGSTAKVQQVSEQLQNLDEETAIQSMNKLKMSEANGVYNEHGMMVPVLSLLYLEAS